VRSFGMLTESTQRAMPREAYGSLQRKLGTGDEVLMIHNVKYILTRVARGLMSRRKSPTCRVSIEGTNESDYRRGCVDLPAGLADHGSEPIYGNSAHE
jgi:hypothetical protein